VSPAEVGRYLDTTRGRPLKGTHSSGPSRVLAQFLVIGRGTHLEQVRGRSRRVTGVRIFRQALASPYSGP